MGNGVSTDQGNLPPHGSRDVRNPEDEEQHDWSQLARAPNTNTALLVDHESYNGAQLRGQKLSKFAEDDTRHEDDQPRGRQSLNAVDDDTQHSRQRSSVMQDDN